MLHPALTATVSQHRWPDLHEAGAIERAVILLREQPSVDASAQAARLLQRLEVERQLDRLREHLPARARLG
jgi:hypothetical protein